MIGSSGTKSMLLLALLTSDNALAHQRCPPPRIEVYSERLLCQLVMSRPRSGGSGTMSSLLLAFLIVTMGLNFSGAHLLGQGVLGDYCLCQQVMPRP